MLRVVAAVVVAAVAAVFGLLHQARQADLPAHLLGHAFVSTPNLLTPDEGDALMALVKDMGEFPTNAGDLQFYKTRHEHIGEARPVENDGGCSHPFLVPNTDRSLCVLPGRVDIARHFITSGGVEGLKDPYHVMASRVQSFGRYMFDLEQFPVVQALFASPAFQKLAVDVCPAAKRHLDPFQFNFIVQLPGQSVALHLDAPYFWGATRFQFPQWLLAVMTFSGLFQAQFIDQVQVVAYLHQWNPTPERAGNFVYWGEKGRAEMTSVEPEPLAGNGMDGSKTVHAAATYMPQDPIPTIDKSKTNLLKYKGYDEWDLLSNGERVRTYTTDDLRVSVVYRARCFANATEAERFHNQGEDDEMTLDHVLGTLKADLVARGRASQEGLDALDRLDLGILLLNEYVRYPLSPTATIPFNYCALPRLAPWTERVLRFVC